MTWFSSIFIAFLSGLLGVVCAAFIALLCAEWYHIQNFEGKAGYFTMFVALLGGVVGSVVGIIASRIVAPDSVSGFFKGLGVGLGAVLLIALVALAICRWFADIAPTIDGKSLALEIEVRCPKKFSLPKVLDEYGATAEVSLPGGRRQQFVNLKLDDVKTVDGFLLVTATVPLDTSATTKYLDVRFSKEYNLSFALPARPQREWSEWFSSAWKFGKPEPAKEEKFNARSRVVLVDASLPPPERAYERAKEFAALTPDAPLEQWLPFLFNDLTPERTAAVVKQIDARQLELAKLIGSADATVREHALHAAAYPTQPAPELTEAVLAEGRAIAAAIRRCNAMKPGATEFIDALVPLRGRFYDWKLAWWTIHQRLGVDGRPPAREIHELAKVRAAGTAMGEIEVNARVILEEMDKMAAEKKP